MLIFFGLLAGVIVGYVIGYAFGLDSYYQRQR